MRGAIQLTQSISSKFKTAFLDKYQMPLIHEGRRVSEAYVVSMTDTVRTATPLQRFVSVASVHH
jgi:hypothetical protein